MMSIKSRLMEFIVVHDLVPLRIRWSESASAVGRIFNDVYHLLDKEDRIKLTDLMHSWGLEDSEEAVKTLKIQRDLHGCAVAVLALHRIFGIKSSIASENETEIKIRATECLWKDKKGWSPEVCASIDAYERGLVEGVNSSIKNYYAKRRSRGDEFCELVLKKQ